MGYQLYVGFLPVFWQPIRSIGPVPCRTLNVYENQNDNDFIASATAQPSSPCLQSLTMLTPPPHKVIALISGGKDSFLALLHCLAQKSDIVALANLYPAPTPPTLTHDFPLPSSDPNDSHMYQTAGHTLIPLYALALRIPLYRGQISRRGALNLERNYSFSSPEKENPSNDEDETESLLLLLRRLKELHPDASAVCSGAILSTYQRTRIESVALRLGLVPFAPLWEYPFLPRQNPGASEGLLEDVGLVGLKARIIKVASGGLDEGLLWGDLSDRKIRHKEIGRAHV